MGECARFYKNKVSDALWRQFYDTLQRSDRMRASFPHLEFCSFTQFKNMLAGPDRHSWVLTFKRELAGGIYLTDLDGTSARIHFAFLPTKATRSATRMPAPLAIARFAVASLLRDKQNGEYILDSVIGFTPVTNKSAIKLISREGAYVLGEIPAGYKIAGEKRNVPALVTYYTRETTDEAWCHL